MVTIASQYTIEHSQESIERVVPLQTWHHEELTYTNSQKW